MYSIGSNEARILVDIPNDLIKGDNKAASEYIEKVTLPQLPLSLQEPLREALSKGGLRSMPNSTLHPTSLKYKGVVIMGDAWNMRHPLTGGGMTVALSDVATLRDLLSKQNNLEDSKAMDSIINQFYCQRKPTACTINSLAHGIYNVFRGSEDMKEMRVGCMKYFQLGGRCVSTPMALLSGLENSLYSLIGHYIAVALYGVFWLLYPIPTPSNIKKAFFMLITAGKVMWDNKDEVLTPKYLS